MSRREEGIPPPANPDGGFGCGSVRINFRDAVELERGEPAAMAPERLKKRFLQAGPSGTASPLR